MPSFDPQSSLGYSMIFCKQERKRAYFLYFFQSYMPRSVSLPADPEERRVAMARHGLPGQTRTSSSWQCRQMTWSSGLSPTLLQPTCSLPAWIFMSVLIRWTSRMSVPAQDPASSSPADPHILRMASTSGAIDLWLKHPSLLESKHCLHLLPRSSQINRVSCSRARAADDVAVFTHD